MNRMHGLLFAGERDPLGTRGALALLLAVVVASCASDPAPRAAAAPAASTSASAAPTSASAAPDQAQSEREGFVTLLCGPDQWLSPCFFREDSECKREVDSHWSECAKASDPKASDYDRGRQMVDCVLGKVGGGRKPRTDNPECAKRLPKK